MRPPPQQGELSGARWADRFPTSTSTADLAQPFQGNVNTFISALRAAGTTIAINATYRPPERAYLMHYSFRIAREGLDPANVPARAGVDIRWLHTNAQGRPDLGASRQGAEAMVRGYGIVHRPVLASRHTERLAIDMDISWSRDLVITDRAGQRVTISSVPRTGAGNQDLHRVGASYGVHKLAGDPPHWSSDGH
jgi:hypothetical protein